jgi:hypothetical protein
MLTKNDIIDGLNSIANDYSGFAIAWHVFFYFLASAFLIKWQPDNRVLLLLTCLPLLSVALLAWITGNPFNGLLFSVMSALVIICGVRVTPDIFSLSQLPFLLTGIVMVIFGLVYPHFIKTNSIIEYLYASPAGLIPCPTLSVLTGSLLIFNGLGSPPVVLMFIIFGLFYSIFGIIRLRVYIDLFLLLGSVTLLVKYLVY